MFVFEAPKAGLLCQRRRDHAGAISLRVPDESEKGADKGSRRTQQ